MNELRQKKSKIAHMPQLIENMVALGYTSLFPVQQATLQLDPSDNLFIQSPCGSGKTLGALLPFLVDDRPTIVVYVAPTPLLCVQISTLLKKLTEGISFFSVHGAEFELLEQRVPTNQCHFVVTTPTQLRLFLCETAEVSPGVPVRVIIDEADAQVRRDEGVFKDVFWHLQTKQLPFRLSNSPFALREMSQQGGRLSCVLLSATLIQNEFLFNGLQLLPGRLVRPTFVKNYRSLYVQAAPSYESLYPLIQCGQIPLPAIVFCESYQALSVLAMDLLQSRRQEDVVQPVINVWMQGWRSVETDGFSVNRTEELKENDVILTLDEHARGLDRPEINAAVSLGKVDVETLTHRLGRAGRAGRMGVGVVLQPEISGEVSALLGQLGQIQIVEKASDEDGGNTLESGAFLETEEQGRQFRDALQIAKAFNEWRGAQNAPPDLFQFVENMGAQ